MTERQFRKLYAARPELEYLGEMTRADYKDTAWQERIALVDVRLQGEHSMMHEVFFRKKVLFYSEHNALTRETDERKKRGFRNIVPMVAPSDSIGGQ